MEETTKYELEQQELVQEPEDKPLGQKGEAALKAEREENKRLKQMLKELQSKQEQLASVDIEEYKSLKEAQEKAQNEKLATEKRFEDLSKRLNTSLQEKEKIVATLSEQLKEQEKRMAIAQYYYSLGGKEEAAEGTTQSAFNVLYEQVLKPRIEMGDKGEIIILSKDGLTEDRKEDGKPKTIRDLILEISESKIWGNFFEKPEVKGGGITQGVRRGLIRQTFQDRMREMGYLRDS